MLPDDEGKSAYGFFEIQAALNLFLPRKEEEADDYDDGGLPPETRLLLLRLRAREREAEVRSHHKKPFHKNKNPP